MFLSFSVVSKCTSFTLNWISVAFFGLLNYIYQGKVVIIFGIFCELRANYRGIGS